MSKISQNKIKQLAENLMFELTQDELVSMEAHSEAFLHYIGELQAIDTTGVEMMNAPFDTVQTWLRDDVVSHTISQDAAFKNAPKVKDDYIEVVQVIEK